MSTYPTDKRLESLKELIIPIEKELIEISNMAVEISEKFQGISRDIESLSGSIGVLAGRKAGAITSLAGGIFSVIGDMRADEERQRALRKLLPKKQELANLKTSLITSFRDSMNNKIESLSLLLIEEVNRPYDETNRAEYEDLYGNSCLDAFDLYVSTYYMIQLCDFMLLEFSAWIEYKHESGYESPDKSFVLDVVLNEIIFPNGLKNGISTDSSNAGIWLLTKRDSILAGSMYKKFVEGKKIEENKKNGFYSESYKKTRVVERESFKSLKTYVGEIEKTISEDKTGNLKILTNSNIYKQASSICNIRSPKKYFFNVAFLTVFIIGLLQVISGKESFLKILMYSFIFALIHSLVTRFWLWQKNVVSSEGGCLNSLFELMFKLLITVLSLGTVPLLVYLYEKKENKFEIFVNNLRTNQVN